MRLVEGVRENIRLLLEQINVPYEITPFDEVLYQECIDDAVRRSYQIDGNPPLRTYLRGGVVYAATAGVHLPHRPTQIWIALYTACILFVDDIIDIFPDEMPNIYLFSDRLIARESQGNGILDALADVIRRASDYYRPVAYHLITSSAMSFIASNLMEHEMRSMEILGAAQAYPTFQRILSGSSGVYAFTVFPREIPVNDYIQAIPEMILFINNVNDIISFYKEERAGETVNQISMQATCTKKSKLDVLDEMTETVVGVHRRIIKILQGSPEACEVFKKFVGGYVRFHTSLARYRMEELSL